MASSKKLKVALAQMAPVWENKAQNQIQAKRLVRLASGRKADVVVFPEMTLTGFSMNTKKTAEENVKGETVQFFRALSKLYRIAIIFGMVTKKKDDRRSRNAAMVFDKQGKLVSRYDKMHPFSFGGEDKYFRGGSQLGIFKLKGWKAAVVICYDLRFSGLFGALGKKRPEVIFVIANWPMARAEHWKTLLPARALDTQAFMVAVNMVGKSGGKTYSGDSAVYSPRGEKALDLKNKSSLGFYTIDASEVVSYRQSFSSLRDQRHGVYKRLL